jgi:hypothetical protein
VDVDPLLTSVPRRDLHQAVNQALAELCVLHHLGEFLVQENVRLPPVDLAVGSREVEGHELREVARQRVFPRGVVVQAAPSRNSLPQDASCTERAWALASPRHPEDEPPSGPLSRPPEAVRDGRPVD